MAVLGERGVEFAWQKSVSRWELFIVEDEKESRFRLDAV